MKKNEIVVGGLYTARISGNFVTVRVDQIRESWVGVGVRGPKLNIVYDVTNLKTGREVTFRSAQKFRSKATEPKAKEDVAYERAAAATVRHDLRQKTEAEMDDVEKTLTATIGYPPSTTEPEPDTGDGSESMKEVFQIP